MCTYLVIYKIPGRWKFSTRLDVAIKDHFKGIFEWISWKIFLCKGVKEGTRGRDRGCGYYYIDQTPRWALYESWGRAAQSIKCVPTPSFLTMPLHEDCLVICIDPKMVINLLFCFVTSFINLHFCFVTRFNCKKKITRDGTTSTTL